MLHLALHHPKLFSNILHHLTHEDKRKLYFTNTQLQHALSQQPTMSQFSRTLQLQTLTFYFPAITYGKKGPLRTKYRTSLTTIVNTNATKLTCNSCHIPYYNPNHEKHYTDCRQHANYTWTNNNMYIIKKGYDLLGRLHTTKQYFQPIGSNRTLCYCQVCRLFLFYLTGNDVTYITCYNCKRSQTRLTRYQIPLPRTYKQRFCPICQSFLAITSDQHHYNNHNTICHPCQTNLPANANQTTPRHNPSPNKRY